MIFINLQINYILKLSVMGNSCHTKKKKKSKSAFYFIAITAFTAAACIFIIKEGQRVKIENELLAYEVW
jgi:hypothetical protein